MLRVVAAVLFPAAAVAAGPAASAQPHEPLNAIIVDKQAPSVARAAAAQALLQKAQAKGRVRVIVGLTLTLKAPHELDSAQAAAQTRSLRAEQDAVVARVLGAGASGVTRFDYIPFVSLSVNAAQLRRLLDDPSVVNIEEDVPARPTLNQSIPFSKINKVWQDGFTGRGITVAILDTGVDKTHDMFAGGSKVVSEACYSGNATDSSSVCPGGVAESTAPGSGSNCPAEVNGCDHGTHVAGIAAGAMRDLRGAARGADIIAIQVFSRVNDCSPSPSPCVRASTTDQIKGLERVYALRSDFRIAAVNMSLGSGVFNAPCSSAREPIIGLLRAAKIATVISSGNDSSDAGIGSPACISAAIAVGSTLDNANTVSSFSNHFPLVRLMAPGSNIVSAVPPGPATTAQFNGTSMAAPHVTGAFALLRDAVHNATVDDISAALECTGIPVQRNFVTEPRINVDAALDYLLDPPNAPLAYAFNDPAEADDWTPLRGRWSIAEGRYRQGGDPVGWRATLLPVCNEAVTIETRIRRIEPIRSGYVTGLFFKTEINQAGKVLSGLFAGFGHTSDDSYVVLRRFNRLDMDANTLASYQDLCVNLDIDPPHQAFVRLKVVSQAGRHRIFVNNVLACDITDFAYGAGGHTGPGAFYPDPTSGHRVDVEWFNVTPNEVDPPGPTVAPAIVSASTGMRSSTAPVDVSMGAVGSSR